MGGIARYHRAGKNSEAPEPTIASEEDQAAQPDEISDEALKGEIWALREDGKTSMQIAIRLRQPLSRVNELLSQVIEETG